MLLVVGCAVCLLSEMLLPGDHSRSMEIDGQRRTYQVHIPSQPPGPAGLPLVFIFHGMGGDAPAITKITGMTQKADQAGFIVVYPEGSGSKELRTWEAGQRRGPDDVQRPDDVEFVRRLLEELPNLVPLDATRVYAAGISNGGMLCYRLASEMSDRFAAIASVAGPTAYEVSPPTYPVPVLHFHGLADRVVPATGPAKGTPAMIRFDSVDRTVERWRQFNNCEATPTISSEPDRVVDATTVTRHYYAPKQQGGAEVILYLIEGGGHTWPGQPPQFPFAGRSTKDIVANDIIWEFFARHRRLRPVR
jgi:polyhydroxybutyrate depolymerase